MSRKTSPISLEESLETSGKELIGYFGRHVNPPMARLLKLVGGDKVYRRAEGFYVYDENGKRYADLTAGFGSLNLGHNPKEVLDAVALASEFPAVMVAGLNPLAGVLAHNLSTLLPGDLSAATFGNGGAEAVEIALRTARAYTKRKRFVSCEGGYHGLSFGAMSVCGTGKYCDHLGPLMSDCERVPFGDTSALGAALKGEDVAGFIVEPVQGEGGARVPPKGYLREAEELCRRHGTLLILDEIQTGFGRTGRMFALEHDKVTPDILTLSKSLGGGVMPISVSITTPEIFDKAFGHGDDFDMTISTFGGNARACAAAIKTIEILLRDRIPERAEALGERARKGLEAGLAGNKHVNGISGRGLLLGIELRTPSIPGADMERNFPGMVLSRLLNDESVLTSYCDLAPATLRFEPPLTVTEGQVDESVAAFERVLKRSTLGLTLSMGKTIIKRSVTGN